MDEFLKITDEKELSISKKIEDNIKVRGKNTDERDKISKSFEFDDANSIAGIKTILKCMENKCNIKKNRPLISYDEKLSRTRFLIRKVIRKLIKWYIVPIINEQNDYNNMTLEAIKHLEERIEKLEHINE